MSKGTSVFFICFVLYFVLVITGSAEAEQSPFIMETIQIIGGDQTYFGQELRATLNTDAIKKIMENSNVIIKNLPLIDGTMIDIKLYQFSPFSPGAQIINMTDEGPEYMAPDPNRKYYKGKIAGMSSTIAFFVFWHDGFSGYLQLDNARFIYGVVSDYDGPKAVVTQFDPSAYPEKYYSSPRDLDDIVEVTQLAKTETLLRKNKVVWPGTVKTDIAAEMDYESYTHFGSVTAASNYATDLIAAISVFYENDIDEVIGVANIRVWSTSSDPYSDGTDTSVLLDDIKAEYLANMTGLTRASAILLSRRNMGGLAWRIDGGLLCDNSWAYAVVGIDGTYTYPTAAYTWDADATAHELGHNHGSQHTHCYQDGGSWLDCCYASESGCCPGPAVNEVGTIMSYCHLQPAGKVLVFHNYVQPIIRQGAENGSCVYAFGSPGTIVEDIGDQGVRVDKATDPISMSYSLDDGYAESSVGYSGTTQLAWVNEFTPTQYPYTINQVDAIFSHPSVAVGRDIRILIYRGASLASSSLDYTEDVTIQVISTSQWNTYVLATPVTITSDSFWVGFYDLVLDTDASYIAAADMSTPHQNRSYGQANSTNPASYGNWGGTYNWQIRTHGTVPPGADDILISWGDPCNIATEPYQDFAVYGQLLSDLPINDYSPVSLDCSISGQEATFNISGDYYFTVIPVIGPIEGGHSFSRPDPASPCGNIDPDPSCP